MGNPPVLEGAVKLTVALLFPAVALPMAGAPGAPRGVTLLEAAEAAPVPATLVDITVKVYGVPLLSPLTTIGLPRPLPVKLPGVEVTV
jgi:hypothetical protein